MSRLETSVPIVIATGWAAPPASGPRPGRAPPGDVEAGSGREAHLLAREPADQRCDLGGLADTAEWNARRHEVDVLLRELLEDRRVDHRGRDAVDENAGVDDVLADRLRDS